MLSGVASDEEVKALAKEFSDGELVRMLSLIQQTAAGFTKSTSRRMDVELCLVNLCQPELCLEPEAMNARITRIEDQLRSGSFTVAAAPASQEEEERPPMPTDDDVPPMAGEEPVMAAQPQDEAPIGFWADLVTQIRSNLKPPMSSFFTTTANAPVQGILQGNRLVLLCASEFAVGMVNKPELLSMIAQKASAKLGRPITVVATDKLSGVQKNEQMERLLEFGRNHSDIVRIKHD